MTRTLGLIGLAATVVGLSTGLSGQARPTAPSPAVPGAGDWPQYANDIRGTKYSPLDQINKDTVGRLSIAWRQSAVPSELKAIWADATGRPRPTQAWWTCAREVAQAVPHLQQSSN